MWQENEGFNTNILGGWGWPLSKTINESMRCVYMEYMRSTEPVYCWPKHLWPSSGSSSHTFQVCFFSPEGVVVQDTLILPLGSSLTTSRPFRHTTFPVAASTNTRDGMLVTLYLFHSFICTEKNTGWEERLEKTLMLKFICSSELKSV